MLPKSSSLRQSLYFLRSCRTGCRPEFLVIDAEPEAAEPPLKPAMTLGIVPKVDIAESKWSVVSRCPCHLAFRAEKSAASSYNLFAWLAVVINVA
ncbi:hypothetical protein EJ03DRAFT_78511 [Teratosphaeria nubilosa]|uniref:Uncharacterized protein n=1 Tax=Teratosphaeria nubilosa TaxID=161662 RepID=A0A6G1LDQ4_9PEZI|nr:hypothetical protein EJ03DRAFT_78511 [Teratosphaeria nubilosa]